MARGIEQSAELLAKISVVLISLYKLVVRFMLGANFGCGGDNQLMPVHTDALDGGLKSPEGDGSASVGRTFETRVELFCDKSDSLTGGRRWMILFNGDGQSVKSGIYESLRGQLIFAKVTVREINGAAGIGKIASCAGRGGSKTNFFLEIFRAGRSFGQTASDGKATAGHGLELKIGGPPDMGCEGDGIGVKDETLFDWLRCIHFLLTLSLNVE